MIRFNEGKETAGIIGTGYPGYQLAHNFYLLKAKEKNERQEMK
jgi:hypothetical protein